MRCISSHPSPPLPFSRCIASCPSFSLPLPNYHKMTAIQLLNTRSPIFRNSHPTHPSTVHISRGEYLTNKVTRFPSQFPSPRASSQWGVSWGVPGSVLYDVRSCQQPCFFTMETREEAEAGLKVKKDTDKQQESKASDRDRPNTIRVSVHALNPTISTILDCKWPQIPPPACFHSLAMCLWSSSCEKRVVSPLLETGT